MHATLKKQPKEKKTHDLPLKKPMILCLQPPCIYLHERNPIISQTSTHPFKRQNEASFTLREREREREREFLQMMIMRKKVGLGHWLLLMQMQYHCLYGALTAATLGQEKAEAAIPITAMSPPEGNTTFLGGTTWCVALSGVPQADLQSALDWACGLGMANCKPIRDGGACFEPDTLVSHASYAFNNYYQQNGNLDIACSFGGTAALTNTDPSHGKCVYAASGLASSAPPRPEHDQGLFGYTSAGILLMFLLRSPCSLLL